MAQSKKQMKSINSKNEDKKNPLTQRTHFKKLFLNKYLYDINYSNILSKFKGSKKLSSKYNTLKNSRKKYFIFIFNIYFIIISTCLKKISFR